MLSSKQPLPKPTKNIGDLWAALKAKSPTGGGRTKPAGRSAPSKPLTYRCDIIHVSLGAGSHEASRPIALVLPHAKTYVDPILHAFFLIRQLLLLASFGLHDEKTLLGQWTNAEFNLQLDHAKKHRSAFELQHGKRPASSKIGNSNRPQWYTTPSHAAHALT
jgi:hypothetical protein